MKRQMNRIRIGTRVLYRIPPGGYGNPDLEGYTGTVIYIDHTAVPITVQLDEPYIGAVPEQRIPRDDPEAVSACRKYKYIPNCWFCKTENLIPVKERTHRKQKGENGSWHTKNPPAP